MGRGPGHGSTGSMDTGVSAVMVLGAGSRAREGTVGSLPASSELRWEEDASCLDRFGEMDKRDVPMSSDSAWVLSRVFSLGTLKSLGRMGKGTSHDQAGFFASQEPVAQEWGLLGILWLFSPGCFRNHPVVGAQIPQAVQNHSVCSHAPYLTPIPTATSLWGHSRGEG